MHFPSSHIDEPCGSKADFFYIFCVALHIFVAGNRRHFMTSNLVCQMLIDHSKSQSTDVELSQNGRGHVM